MARVRGTLSSPVRVAMSTSSKRGVIGARRENVFDSQGRATLLHDDHYMYGRVVIALLLRCGPSID
jgi:hypothetical protein